MMHRRPPPPPDQLAALHRQQEAVLAAARASRPPPCEGAGIVMVAGGGQAFVNAWVALTVLREHRRCTLPVQVWHLGPAELSPHMRALLERFDVELVDAFEVRERHPMPRLGPWECKAFALLHCPFRHAILLDADNVPLIDPERLLDTPEYRENGALFWSDNHTHLPSSPVWPLFDVPYREELEVESGQLVVDRRRCWVALNLAVHYNARSDVYYRYIYGDKETFHFAWRRAGQQYARTVSRPRTVYCHWETPQGRQRMTAALEHEDFRGRAAFHHRTGAKWALFGGNPTSGNAELDAVAAAALDTLRDCWDGRVLPDPPPGDRPSATQLRQGGRVRYRRFGVDERTILLEPDGRISGGTEYLSRWRATATEVVLSGDAVDTVRLALTDGVWHGSEQFFAQHRAELIPLP